MLFRSGANVVVVVLVTELLSPRKSALKSDSKKRDTKKGRMDRTSMMLRVSTTNWHFLGAPANLRKYSRVNQAMQMVSIMLSQGFSDTEPSLA